MTKRKVRSVKHKRRRGGRRLIVGGPGVDTSTFGRWAPDVDVQPGLEENLHPVGPSAKVSTAGFFPLRPGDFPEFSTMRAYGKKRRRRGGAIPYLVL